MTFECIKQCLKNGRKRALANELLVFLTTQRNKELKLLRMINFFDSKIPIYGTVEDPLFKTSDIMI